MGTFMAFGILFSIIGAGLLFIKVMKDMEKEKKHLN